MQVTIRPAHPDDVEALSNLYVEFHNFHACGVPTRLQPVAGVTGELRQAVRDILANPEAAVFVAALSGEVVGFVELYRKEAAADPAVVPRTYAHLQSLMVTERVRRYGVGAHLVEAAHTWAREQGATAMELDIWEFDAGPLGFYERLGYRTMRRQLVHLL